MILYERLGNFMSKTYIHYGHSSFDRESFNHIKRHDISTKPSGGLWGSPIKAKYGWKNWCQDNEFRECLEENSFRFKLDDNANILCINNVDDLNFLPQIKGELIPPVWVLLDFEELKRQYDAIEVNISNDYGLYWKLYGWDCDSILVMNSDVVVEI